jgi:NAD(P)H-dependent flavin oxidoreductase YrpB (nitropropane dioxygenase family)
MISVFWKDPMSLVGIGKDAGTTVMHTVGNAADARRAVDSGLDIVVTQGWGTGGHVRA